MFVTSVESELPVKFFPISDRHFLSVDKPIPLFAEIGINMQSIPLFLIDETILLNMLTFLLIDASDVFLQNQGSDLVHLKNELPGCGID